jgi:hypothetical protein
MVKYNQLKKYLAIKPDNFDQAFLVHKFKKKAAHF